MNECAHCGQQFNTYMDNQGNYWCPQYIAEEYGYTKED